MKNSETVLVTGGTGFVGSHCILQLLQKGYNVKTTLRSLNRKQEVIDMMKSGGITSFDNIEFIEADLTKDDNWDAAVKDCKYVLHVALPIPALRTMQKDENEWISPAVDGTIRVLTAARDAGIKRVVMTSNFGAVGLSHKDPNTEITDNEWTDPNEAGLSPYNKSKLFSERAAWDFINKEGGGLELTTINPVAILGPALGPSAGFDLLKPLLNGTMKAVPPMRLNIVDVRDVADLHIRAMTNPEAKGQRFLAVAGGIISLPEIASLIKSKMPEIAEKVPVEVLPDNGNLMAKANRNVSNAKAKEILGWTPIANNEEAILASVESIVKLGILK
jgi:nucleoside-diphosphate-sugar epimerase